MRVETEVLLGLRDEANRFGARGVCAALHYGLVNLVLRDWSSESTGLRDFLCTGSVQVVVSEWSSRSCGLKQASGDSKPATSTVTVNDPCIGACCRRAPHLAPGTQVLGARSPDLRVAAQALEQH